MEERAHTLRNGARIRVQWTCPFRGPSTIAASLRSVAHSTPVGSVRETIETTVPEAQSSALESSLGRGPLLSYVVVFERDASRTFQLPWTGDLVIGRSETAEVQLQDPAVSRDHARIFVRDGR